MRSHKIKFTIVAFVFLFRSALPLLSQVVPTISSPSSTNIATNSVTLGANITSDGGSTITERGVVWSLNANPTIGSFLGIKTSVGQTGTFTVDALNLSPNTTYHFRGYAINAIGTSYTSDATFTSLPTPATALTIQGPSITYRTSNSSILV